MSAPRHAFAPAKVNLFLHVGARQEDGYHPLASLMAFADVGDQLSAAVSDTPGLRLIGPFAGGLEGADNLVVQAARLVLRKAGPRAAVELVLDKRLPIAAGLGGGSSDAAAALRLLCEVWEVALDDDAVVAMARELGADVAACLGGRAVLATGRGDLLHAAPALPGLEAVLVNPRQALSTAAVYQAFDAAPPAGAGADMPNLPERFEDAIEAAAVLSGCRNDLEAPAVSLAPRVGDVLEILRGEPETLMARMSGSGATCFALCIDDYAAESLAERVEAMRPGWWVERCRLG